VEESPEATFLRVLKAGALEVAASQLQHGDSRARRRLLGTKQLANRKNFGWLGGPPLDQSLLVRPPAGRPSDEEQGSLAMAGQIQTVEFTALIRMEYLCYWWQACQRMASRKSRPLLDHGA
jgi:hypothetical protein